MKKQTKHQGNLTTLRVIKREDTKGEHCRKPPNIKTTEKKQPARTDKKEGNLRNDVCHRNNRNKEFSRRTVIYSIKMDKGSYG